MGTGKQSTGIGAYDRSMGMGVWRWDPGVMRKYSIIGALRQEPVFTS